jgi:hypothetical protein
MHSKNSVDINFDERGSLGVIEFSRIPFTPHRFFWIFGTPQNTSRAGHGHTICEQFLLVQAGTVKIQVTNCDHEVQSLTLEPGDSYHLTTYIWLELLEFSSDAILGGCASIPYDRSEYVDSFEELVVLAKEKKN